MMLRGRCLSLTTVVVATAVAFETLVPEEGLDMCEFVT